MGSGHEPVRTNTRAEDETSWIADVVDLDRTLDDSFTVLDHPQQEQLETTSAVHEEADGATALLFVAIVEEVTAEQLHPMDELGEDLGIDAHLVQETGVVSVELEGPKVPLTPRQR